jgi:hypothetical protein
MDRRKFSLSLMSAAVLAGCGGGGGGDDLPQMDPPGPVPPAGPELATPTTLPAITLFARTGTASDGEASTMGPGQSNTFELKLDFSLDDGGNDQFDDALLLSLTVGGSTLNFPEDQTYDELTAYGPVLSAADGVKAASITTEPDWVETGNASAVLPCGLDTRLQQTLNLGPAAGHNLELSWSGETRVGRYSFDEPYYFQVVIRDASGAVLSTLYREEDSGTTGTWGIASLTAFAGRIITLSFEQRSSSGLASVIDNVSVIDTDTGTEYVVNGDFEGGATGWTLPVLPVVQNIASGVRAMAGLGTVQRHFFTQPNVLWGRMTDVFTNTSGADVAASITYSSNLGSDGVGVIYEIPGAPTKALATWDGGGRDRDAGFVFGTRTSVDFTSSTGLGVIDGHEVITWTFDVTIPAGQSITLVNFVILSETDTSQTATDVTARATEVDTLAVDIANNFRTNFAYQRGMTQAQLDTLKNF